jgi:hypothetical protein
MDEKLLVALVSGGFVLVAALVGAIATWIVGRRESNATRNQRRSDIKHDKLADILPKINERLYDLIGAFRTLVEQPVAALDERAGIDQRSVQDNMDARRRKTRELKDRVLELQDYRKRHAVWIPNGLAQQIDALADELIGRMALYVRRVSIDMEYATTEADLLASVLANREESARLLAPYEAELEALGGHRSEKEGSDHQGEEFLAAIEETFGKEAADKIAEGEKPQTVDPLTQHAGKTRGEIYLEVFEERYAKTKKYAREWLRTEAEKKYEEIRRTSRDVLAVNKT